MKNSKSLLVILFAILLGGQAPAQESPEPLPCGVPPSETRNAEPLYPMPFEGKWGFVDRSGAWAVPPTWERVTDFSEGLATVAEVDGLWGVIDSSGEYVLEPSLRSQSFIRWEGRRITDPPLKPFSEGCAAGVGETTSATPFFVDRSGNIHWAEEHPEALANLDVHEFGSFSEGKAWFRVFDMESDLNYGWIDSSGEIILPVEYAGAGDFVGGVAPAASQPYSWAFIDEQGELVLPGKWTLDYAWPYSNGLALVSLGSFAAAYVDSEGIVFDSVTVTGERREELGETLELRAGGEFHDGLAPVSVRSPEGLHFAYVREDGTLAFIPNALPGIEMCDIRSRPEFRNGLVRLLVANDGEECGEVPVQPELPSYDGAHYVYLDTSGEVVLRQGEIAAP